MKTILRLLCLLLVTLLGVSAVVAQDKTPVTVWLDATGDNSNTAKCYVDNLITPFNAQSKTVEVKAELLPNAWDTRWQVVARQIL
jgi:hypothetical protein